MEFTLKTKINASPKDVYEAWLSSEGHSAMTGGEATITNQVGDHFTAWDDYIEGENLALEPNKRIVQSWRTSEFLDNEPDSQIELILKDDGNQTELTLIHTNLSENGEQYKKGWEDHYFEPMRDYFK